MANVARQLRQIATKTGRNVETLIRETNVRLFTKIIMRTPVLDGYLRGGWVAQLDSKPSESPSQVDESGQIAINAARGIAGQLKMGQTYWFVNALPYAKKMEDGGSKQAPTGMVRMSVREVQQIVADEARKLR